jgi:hypothetical protein
MPKYRIVIEGEGSALEPTPDAAPYTADELARRFIAQLRSRNHALTAARLEVHTEDDLIDSMVALTPDLPAVAAIAPVAPDAPEPE